MAYKIKEHKRLYRKALTHAVEFLFGTQYKVLSVTGNAYPNDWQEDWTRAHA